MVEKTGFLCNCQLLAYRIECMSQVIILGYVARLGIKLAYRLVAKLEQAIRLARKFD